MSTSINNYVDPRLVYSHAAKMGSSTDAAARLGKNVAADMEWAADVESGWSLVGGDDVGKILAVREHKH